MNEWIKVNLTDEVIPKGEFLISDGPDSGVFVGFTARDYYDAAYWFPMPKFPFADKIITNDAWVSLALNKENK